MCDQCDKLQRQIELLEYEREILWDDISKKNEEITKLIESRRKAWDTVDYSSKLLNDACKLLKTSQ
jgi:hypothetical protein